MFRDTSILTGRLMTNILRSPDTIITVVLMPLALFLMFRFVMGGAIAAGAESVGNYSNYLLPGILMFAIASGASYTAFRLWGDKQRGVVARFQTMPIARSAVLWSHVLSSVVANLITVVIIVGISFAVGFRPHATFLGWLAILGIVALFILVMTWLAVTPGLAAKTMEGASAWSYPVIFLPLLSSALVPTETMPGPLRWFANNQPMTPIVDTLRSLIENRPVGNDIWLALAWLVGIGIVVYVFAVRSYNKVRG
jgi:ABC-2 type transport system permease protein